MTSIQCSVILVCGIYLKRNNESQTTLVQSSHFVEEPGQNTITVNANNSIVFYILGSQPAGVLRFPVNIAQPQDHRKELKVQSATLKLHRKPTINELESEKDRLNSTKRNVGHNTVLLVYQTLPDNMRRLVTSSVISLANNGLISIDITEIAQNWLDEPAMNYGIEVECTSHNISQILLPAARDSIDIDTAPQPSLEIYTYDSTISTSRRSRRDITEDDICEPGKCCRQAVNITLADVGHHIEGIHEEGAYMTAYLCSGRCPRNYKLHNKWSSVKNIIRNRDRDTDLRNRCAPTSYEKSYSLFSFDLETFSLTFTEYDDLIVKTCGCV